MVQYDKKKRSPKSDPQEFGKGLRKITSSEAVIGPQREKMFGELPIKGDSAPTCSILGQWLPLEVLRITPPGAFLATEEEDVLLPRRYFPEEGLQEGDWVEVFVYHDNEGRLIATTLRPYALLGEVAYLETVQTTEQGAFMTWGIHRDLFVPHREQPTAFSVGTGYPIVVYLDHVSQRLTGSGKLRKHIGNELPTYTPGDRVRALIVEQHERGYRAVVDHKHWGMIYHSDLSVSLSLGTNYEAYVIRTRDDGKLDLSLQPIGQEKLDSDASLLLQILEMEGGHLPLGDKSSPEEIFQRTGLSKKAFKRAVGSLYKRQLISLTPTEIEVR